jgi:hypothetical protein
MELFKTQVFSAVRRLTYVGKVSVLNLDWKTCYADSDFLRVSVIPSGECQIAFF